MNSTKILNLSKEDVDNYLVEIKLCINDNKFIVSQNEKRIENNDFILSNNLNSEDIKKNFIGYKLFGFSVLLKK